MCEDLALCFQFAFGSFSQKYAKVELCMQLAISFKNYFFMKLYSLDRADENLTSYFNFDEK